MDRADDNLFETVEARAKLAGSNRLEILLFSLGSTEIFGINVFKVREVSKTPFITPAPNMPSGVEGLISLRGNVIPVVSLGRALGFQPPDGPMGDSMMVTEYSKRTVGFLVEDVDRIMRIEWDKLRQPDNISGASNNYITAITSLQDGRLVSILDVEAILANIFGEPPIGQINPLGSSIEANVFFVDDSGIARKKIMEVLDKLGVAHKHALNGLEAWTRLQSMASHAQLRKTPLSDELDLILVDAEMPEMDGYVLTRHIKSDARFNGIPVVMHSSLSSEASRAMGKTVGVDAYVAKFDAGILAETMRPYLLAKQNKQ
ncbi:MAG: chemotaxis protein [Betaproteobacteria bacterium]|nr:chemotaxis protein [Betaproteobacteria bacterium]